MTREEAIEVLTKTEYTDRDFYEAVGMAIEALQAEPVVHCRDCKHRHEYRNSEYIDCDCTDFYEMDDNDYCCFGERKEP